MVQATTQFTRIGYAGIALAGLFAVSHAGFTSPIWRSRALSVDIGFGLQSIINNSYPGSSARQRPVKVGD
jgi:small-conductance mechanosensitive channel